MPRSKQAERTFQRTSGNATILLEAGQLWAVFFIPPQEHFRNISSS